MINLNLIEFFYFGKMVQYLNTNFFQKCHNRILHCNYNMKYGANIEL